MMKPQVRLYLAGPISGLTHDEARYGWRKELDSLLPEHIHAYSPMRGKEFLRDVGRLDPTTAITSNPMATDAGIMTRDTNDVRMCDAIVCCFLESGGKVSAGTMIEIGMAHVMGKPIIIVAAPGDPNREHPMARRAAGYVVETLEEASVIVTHLLTPSI